MSTDGFTPEGGKVLWCRELQLQVLPSQAWDCWGWDVWYPQCIAQRRGCVGRKSQGARGEQKQKARGCLMLWQRKKDGWGTPRRMSQHTVVLFLTQEPIFLSCVAFPLAHWLLVLLSQ